MPVEIYAQAGRDARSAWLQRLPVVKGWVDPKFDPSQRAFHYVHVLENPTCRWSTSDALRAGVEPMRGKESVIQERAWTSPIAYVP